MAHENWRNDAAAAARLAKDVHGHNVQKLPIDLAEERTAAKGNLIVWKTGVVKNIRSTAVPNAGAISLSTSPLATESQHTGAQYLIPGSGLEYPTEQITIGNAAQPGRHALIEVSDSVPLPYIPVPSVNESGDVIISAGGGQGNAVKAHFDRLRRLRPMANPAVPFGDRYSNRTTININPGAGFNPNVVTVPAIARNALARGKFRLITSMRCWALIAHESGTGESPQILSAEIRVNVEGWVGGQKVADWGQQFYPQKTDFEFGGLGYAQRSAVYSCAIEPFEIAQKDLPVGGSKTLAENNLSFQIDVISWHYEGGANIPLTAGVEIDYVDADTSAFA